MSAALAAPRSARSVPVRPAGAPVVIAAGGTGGHFFPAEALAGELMRRGHPVTLLTDARSGALASAVFARATTHVLHGAGLAGRGPLRGLAGAVALARGTGQALRLLRALRPAAVVAFGGYPSVAPVLAARALSPRPAVILHEQNAVLGRANRWLARFATELALGMAQTARLPRGIRAIPTGNPVRPAIAALAGAPYTPPGEHDPVRLLVTGGSLGARILSDAVPAALAGMDPPLRARLRVVQQCRPEDLARVRAAYAAMGVEAELAAFFPDMAGRIAAAHLIVARAGASTVAEIAAIGRPAILVPLPGAIDDHQRFNAAAIEAAVIEQSALARDPSLLARALATCLASPDRLAAMARATAAHGRPGAAAALADLVERHLTRSDA